MVAPTHCSPRASCKISAVENKGVSNIVIYRWLEKITRINAPLCLTQPKKDMKLINEQNYVAFMSIELSIKNFATTKLETHLGRRLLPLKPT